MSALPRVPERPATNRAAMPVEAMRAPLPLDPWPPGRGARPAPGARLAPLTGARVLAALLVVIFHFGYMQVPRRTDLMYIPVRLLRNLVSLGSVGVGFFFVLSGFILTYTYLDGRGRLRVSRREFWAARFARIYPVYVLAFVLAAPPFFWYTHPRTLAEPLRIALADLTLTQAWLPSAVISWNGPGWSLSAEAFFYVLFPLCAMPLARLGRASLLIAMALCYAALTVQSLASVLLPLRGTYWQFAVAYLPLFKLPEFLMGVCLARLFTLSRPTTPAGGPRSFMPGRLTAGALLAIVVALCAGPLAPRLLAAANPFDALFALLIYSLAWNQGRVAAFLSLPLMVLLGEASYALYILQVPLWDWMSHLMGGNGNTASPHPAYFVIYLCLALSSAVLTFWLVEKPGRRALRRVLAQR